MSDASPFSKLAPRESQVCRGLSLGVTNTVIAQTLGLKPSTIDSVRRMVFVKLNVSSRVELARLALRHGFVQLDEEWST